MPEPLAIPPSVHLTGGLGGNAAVHLQLTGGVVPVDDGPHLADGVQLGLHKSLAPEAGLHRHHQHHVQLLDIGQNGVGRGDGPQGHRLFHAALPHDSAQVILKPDCVLGLATGSTPIGAYKQLAAWYEKGDVDFAEVSTYNLDEYRGLSHDDPQSYHYFMRENFFDHINIDLNNTHVPDGSNPDAAAACSEYDKIVAAAGYPDLQLLGIGNNGHIGFNEPDDHFSKGTHCVDLTESTIQANSRLFDSIDDVPRQAYTMGTQTIMYARMILVVANGEAKAQAVHDMCYGPVTPACPASILQLHTNCVVVADEAALSLCE